MPHLRHHLVVQIRNHALHFVFNPRPDLAELRIHLAAEILKRGPAALRCRLWHTSPHLCPCTVSASRLIPVNRTTPKGVLSVTAVPRMSKPDERSGERFRPSTRISPCRCTVFPQFPPSPAFAVCFRPPRSCSMRTLPACTYLPRRRARAAEAAENLPDAPQPLSVATSEQRPALAKTTPFSVCTSALPILSTQTRTTRSSTRGSAAAVDRDR